MFGIISIFLCVCVCVCVIFIICYKYVRLKTMYVLLKIYNFEALGNVLTS